MDIKFQSLGDFHIDTLRNSFAYDMPFFHYHSCYELFITIAGSRKMVIQDNIFQGYKGDVFLVSPQHFHRTTGGACSRIVINFSYDYLSRYFQNSAIHNMLTCFDLFRISLTGKDFAWLLEQCNILLNSDSNSPDNTIYLDLAKLLMFLTQKMDYNLKDRETSTSIQLASSILSYINDNYKHISGLEEIADHFFITKEYLCRIFKKCVGTTAMSYLNSLKLKAACELLIGTRKSMTEITAECGFGSPSYFSKIFKDNYRLSPHEYRKHNCFKDITSAAETDAAASIAETGTTKSSMAKTTTAKNSVAKTAADTSPDER